MGDRASSLRRWRIAQCVAAAGFVVAVAVSTLTSADLGFFAYRGGAVLAVAPAGPAAAAGLEAGDLVLEVNGVRISSPGERAAALERVRPGQRVVLRVERRGGGVPRDVVIEAARRQPWTSISGALFAGLLLLFALLGDRGGPEVAARAFFRESVAVVFLLVGAFSWEVTIANPWLAIPWIVSFTVTPALSCHFMMSYPAGAPLGRRALRLLYGPPLAVGAVLSALVVYVSAGGPLPAQDLVFLVAGGVCVLPPLLLVAGGVARARNLRRGAGGLPQGAVRWLGRAGLVAAAPVAVGVVWAAIDLPAFVTGGFRNLLALSVVGAGACHALALTHAPLGEIDRLLRGGGGTLVASCLAAALLVAFLLGAGGAASALSGGVVPAVLAATVVSAALFGPLRERIQRAVEGRLSIDRDSERRMMRDVAAATCNSFELADLAATVTRSLCDALALAGAAVYQRVGGRGESDGWRRIALTGTVPLAERIEPEALEGTAGLLSSRVEDDERGWIIAAAAGRGRPLGAEDGQVLATLSAQVELAFRRARDQARLERLRGSARRRERQLSLLAGRIQEEEGRVRRQASRDGHEPVIGAGLRATFEQARRIGRSEASILIRGETGTGKEVMARVIHAASRRSEGPFAVVDCAALAAGLAESALFGHQRGAFTGAVRDAPGAFRAADGGTLFFDEIADLPLDIQPKLLRALEEREVLPLGATRPLAADVRILSATRYDLDRLVTEGRFRDDLLYRLRVIELAVPPLRERADDILPLAEHFLARRAGSSGGQAAPRLSAGAREALRAHAWPGNVRELENAIEAATVYAAGSDIEAAHLPIAGPLERSRGRARIAHGSGASGLRETLGDLERERILEVLGQHGGNQSSAARALGLSRSALQRRLRRYQREDQKSSVQKASPRAG